MHAPSYGMNMTCRAKLGRSKTPPSVQITAFCLLALVTFAQMSDIVRARPWVKIRNNIGPGQRLWVACFYILLSGGYKKPMTIDFGETYYVRFHSVGLCLETRWWCSFEWENTHKNQTFNVWDHSVASTMPVHCSQCLWEARPDGWYVWDKAHETFQFYKPWMIVNPALPHPALALTEGVLHQNDSQVVSFPRDEKLHGGGSRLAHVNTSLEFCADFSRELHEF